MKFITLSAAALSVVAFVGTAQANDLNDESAVLTVDTVEAPAVSQGTLTFAGGNNVNDGERGNGSRFLSSDR